jgi:hypothetical protein
MRNKNASKRYDFVRKSNEKQDLQRTGKRVRIVNRKPGSRINSGFSGF